MNAILNAPATVDPAMAIGQIAVELPGATAVFRRLKLDFCCGGQVSLRQSAAEKGLDLQALVDELSALQRPDSAPDAGTPAELVGHIVSRYHEVHREQLPELIRMARRVEAVHRANPDVPAGLADALEAMHEELLMHMHKEEAILFPMLQRGGNPFVTQPIGMMRAEHTDHGEALEHLARLTGDMIPPPGACNTWRALYGGLAQFADDLVNHIHLENNVLFPQFEPAAAEQGCGSGCGCS
ncbi:regulator of cell morphogenesis and NO signaling [Oryzisolibacter propanilivorax]|uniref:Regulator of cell morphogenesis and NO signaling n=1 Tax=Oryzisolibacter propanilivorax TaxID=1527607 RepID=A0A1G9PH29_9BURK|nr:iron-sulfur cluster repair protein YtfE [Oryzisolibacter propanilivorax]SDL97455.1 regulator of cell morphogenesis and NO signaling [Oryzisolibacter propanilivorax]